MSYKLVLNSFSGPVFLVAKMGDSQFCDFSWRLQSSLGRDGVVRTCRGSKMKDAPGLFSEFSAAFQFPYYFGHNWPAFEECLSDLSWIPGNAFILCITSATKLLSEDSPALLKILVEVLKDVADEWMNGSSNHELDERSRTPFHIILQPDIVEYDAFVNKILSMTKDVEFIGSDVEVV